MAEDNDATEMAAFGETEKFDPTFYAKLDEEPLTEDEAGNLEIFSNPVDEPFANKYEYTVPIQEKANIGKGIKLAVCCSCLAIFLVLLLLLALSGFCVFIWSEVADLKAAPAISSPEQITSSTLSAQVNTLNDSTKAFFDQLLRNLSIVDSRIQLLSTSAEQERGLNSLSNTFTGQLNSSVTTLIQQMLAESSANADRTQAQELRLTSLERQLNSSISGLSQQLVEDSSAAETRSQQQEMRLNALEGNLNSSVNGINQQLLQVSSMADTRSQQQEQRLNTLQMQLNASLDALRQQVIRDSLVDGNRTQELNSSLHQQVGSLETQVSRMIDGLGGQYPAFAVSSCRSLPPSSPSGFYFISAPNGTAIRVYCDMDRSCGGVTGGWMRLFNLDMTDSNQQCPSGFRQRTDGNFRTCGLTTDGRGCSSTSIPSNEWQYSRVCGRIKAYQVGTHDAFAQRPIDTFYVDGLSLTYGNPRQHIWSFAVAVDERNTNSRVICPCTNSQQTGAPSIPSFVGNNYFCDTGAGSSGAGLGVFYGDDPLFDGAGCGPLNSCCTFNNPPWFHRLLQPPTTDSMELRVCRDQDIRDEDTAVEMVEIYVQ